MNKEIRASERDKELARRLADTLDNSIDALDADTCERLAALRYAATRNTKACGSKRRVAGGFALAAGIVALALVPWPLQLHRENIGNGVIENDIGDMVYFGIDPQMLDDMDMLEQLP